MVRFLGQKISLALLLTIEILFSKFLNFVSIKFKWRWVWFFVWLNKEITSIYKEINDKKTMMNMERRRKIRIIDSECESNRMKNSK